MAYTKKDKEAFLSILQKKNYNVSKACKAFGIDRGRYYVWLKEKWFAQAIEYLHEEDLDDSEETLRLLRKGVPKKDDKGNITGWIIKPEITATIFHLKTKGKSRGYVERNENINIERDDVNIDISKWVDSDE